MILVTGHKGFIGRNLVKHLKQQGHYVVGIDARDDNPFKQLNNLDWSRVDLIYHQGAISNTTEMNVDLVYRYNILFSMNLFNLAAKMRIPVRYASSGSVYGNSKDYSYNPLNYYAMSKLTVDMWVKNNISIFSAPIVGFRYFNVYGNDEDKEDYCTSPVYKFSQQAKNDGVIRVFEGSENTFRDFVCVNDVVDIITSDYYQNDILDVGTSQPISFLDVAILVSKRYNVPIEFIPFPDILKDKYQYYTRAQEHFVGYNFISVEDYVRTSGV